MSQENIIAETWLPLFPGFYQTLYSPDLATEEAEQKLWAQPIFVPAEIQAELPGALEIDIDAYQEAVAAHCVAWVKRHLEQAGFPMDIDYQHVHNPKAYNYENDMIYVRVSITQQVWKKLIAFCGETHWAEWSDHIKSQYSSQAGFVSAYSNDASVWLHQYLDEPYPNSEHCVGRLLEFVLEATLTVSADLMYEEWAEQDSAANYIDTAATLAQLNKKCKTNYTDFASMEVAVEMEVGKAPTKTVQMLTIVLEYKRNRTYCLCPHGLAIVAYSDGTLVSKAGYKSIGCGYDRASTVISEIFNEFLLDLLWAKPDADFPEKTPYGVVRYKGENWYEGGIGAGCYRDIAQYIGGEFKILNNEGTQHVYVYRALPA